MADISTLRHSSAHVLAHAVKNLFKNIKLGIGPTTEDGFYYDFDRKEPFTPEDLKKIEKEMLKLIKQNQEFKKVELKEKEIKSFLKNEPYKKELYEDFKKAKVKATFYKNGDFIDLCAGPHIKNTSEIRAVKLLKIAGAYWKGDSKNKQLQRIYGTAFLSEKDLNDYLKKLEEAEKRDHTKIGRNLDLIMFHDLAAGMPFFLPKGMIMLKELIKFVREYSYGEGYQEVRTPQIFNAELWKISGHWDNYKENMFCIHHAEDNMDLGIKPMNCPAHMLVFKRDIMSYKQLPLRIAEITTLYRNEKSGTLHGLTRVRSLSQDDTHIFLAQDQILDEITRLLDKVKLIYKIFKLNISSVYLSTRPEKFLGKKEQWDAAELNLKKALDKAGFRYIVNKGEGAFYGPKIDINVKDALEREWQLATIQLDYQLPQRFGLTYDDPKGGKKTPVVIHRAILGSMERFLGILIEHFAGRFPLWISPVQVKLLTVTDRDIKFAREIEKLLKNGNIRVELDDRIESMGKKVRDAELQKVNYIVTIGDKETSSKTLAVRTRDEKVKFGIKPEAFIQELKEEIELRKA